MQGFDFGTAELRYLWLAVALGLVHLVLYVLLAGGTPGRVGWALGARDEAGPAPSKIGGRADRAWKNYVETFALFAAVVLMANALGKHNARTLLGSELFFWGRVAYIPLYLFGVPFVRTLAWIAAIVGIVFVFLGIYPG